MGIDEGDVSSHNTAEIVSAMFLKYIVYVTYSTFLRTHSRKIISTEILFAHQRFNFLHECPCTYKIASLRKPLSYTYEIPPLLESGMSPQFEGFLQEIMLL